MYSVSIGHDCCYLRGRGCLVNWIFRLLRDTVLDLANVPKAERLVSSETFLHDAGGEIGPMEGSEIVRFAF